MSPKTTPRAAKPRPADPACAAALPFLREDATFMRAILRPDPPVHPNRKRPPPA